MREAVLTAGRVRLRPIMITALALVIGSMVLLSDPIFQGMAVSLLFGSLVATFLTLIVIPLGCISARKYFKTREVDDDDDDGDDGAPPTGRGPGRARQAPARLRLPRRRAARPAARSAWSGAATERPHRRHRPRRLEASGRPARLVEESRRAARRPGTRARSRRRRPPRDARRAW